MAFVGLKEAIISLDAKLQDVTTGMVHIFYRKFPGSPFHSTHHIKNMSDLWMTDLATVWID